MPDEGHSVVHREFKEKHRRAMRGAQTLLRLTIAAMHARPISPGAYSVLMYAMIALSSSSLNWKSLCMLPVM